MFALALLALLALMLVPALTALRRSEAIYGEIRASQEQFQETQRVFAALSQNVFAISLSIREFLLDTSPDAARLYRSRLDTARDQLHADVARLAEILPPDSNSTLQRLKEEVDGYLAAVHSVFEWTAQERGERGSFFLRQEQRPRRESILAVAQQLSTLSAAIYAQQQKQTTESEVWFERELTRSVLYALIAGIVISTGGMLRMRWLERRAAEQRQHAEETTEEIRKLSSQIRRAQEEERRTISRELHDDVGQKLTAMRMELGTLEQLRSTTDGEFDVRLAEVKALAEQSLQVIRHIAAGLRPSALDDLGLPAAVQKQVRQFSGRTGMHASVDVQGPFTTLADPHRTYIYRIVQELLTNCAKHSRAAHVRLSLVDAGEHIELTVVDDGVGFDPGRIPHPGLGLIGMEERVRELGGTTAIRAASGEGASIRVRIPI